MKKIFVIPNNDADSIRIQEMLRDQDVEVLITGQHCSASYNRLESDILDRLNSLLSDEEVYFIELKDVPTDNPNYFDVNNHVSYDENGNIHEETALEKVAEMFNLKLTNLDYMLGANDVGFIGRMRQMAQKLGLSQEEEEMYVEVADRYEYIGKMLSKMGDGRTPYYQCEEMCKKIKEYHDYVISISSKAINDAYVYDKRLIIIDLENFDMQKNVLTKLYELGKYDDSIYSNVVIYSKDELENKRMFFFGSFETIKELDFLFENPDIKLIGGEGECGFIGMQINDKEKYNETKIILEDYLEERLLGYHRIVKQSDIDYSKEREDCSDNIRIHRINNGKTFYEALNKAKVLNNHSQYVTLYDKEYYDNQKLFLVNAGCAGCCVTENGDIESVFKNPDMAEKDDIDKISSALLLTAIENGGKRLDCFDGFLVTNYMKHGFIPVCKVPFNDEYAPDDWNYERDGRPSVIFFIHNGDSSEEILKKIADNTWERYDLSTLPVFEGDDGYDNASKYAQKIIVDTSENESAQTLLDD